MVTGTPGSGGQGATQETGLQESEGSGSWRPVWGFDIILRVPENLGGFMWEDDQTCVCESHE